MKPNELAWLAVASVVAFALADWYFRQVVNRASTQTVNPYRAR